MVTKEHATPVDNVASLIHLYEHLLLWGGIGFLIVLILLLHEKFDWLFRWVAVGINAFRGKTATPPAKHSTTKSEQFITSQEALDAAVNKSINGRIDKKLDALKKQIEDQRDARDDQVTRIESDIREIRSGQNALMLKLVGKD